MFYTFVFFSLFLLLPDREREGRVVGGTALYHLNTRRVVAAYSREFVGKIVEGKIAPRATFHFPAKCALLRPPTNNDFHRFDETFFLPSQTRFSSFPLLPLSLSLSLSRTRHTRLILVYIRIDCCFVSRVEICFYYSCDKLFGKKFTLVTRLIHVSISSILCSNIFFLLSKHFQIQLNSYHISMILGLIIKYLFYFGKIFNRNFYRFKIVRYSLLLKIIQIHNNSSNNFLANFEKSQ